MWRELGIWGASAVWSSLSAMARAGVDREWIKNVRLQSRVVSVGNIQVGGAGKTPLVAEIARQAHARGLRACILIRGYGGEWERAGGVIRPKSANSGVAMTRQSCSVQWGDEATLLHELAPQAWVGVGADRVAQYEKVLSESGGIDLVILDDGFQHYRIHKDVEIVALTSAKRSQVLHRDSISALKKADLRVWTKGDSRPKGWEDGDLQLRFRLAVTPLDWGPIWLVTGVADGAEVLNLARAAGYNVVKHVSFGDHAHYSQTEVSTLLRDASRAGARIAITGKDHVKWRDLSLGVETNEMSRVLTLEPEIEWVKGEDRWNRVLWGS